MFLYSVVLTQCPSSVANTSFPSLIFPENWFTQSLLPRNGCGAEKQGNDGQTGGGEDRTGSEWVERGAEKYIWWTVHFLQNKNSSLGTCTCYCNTSTLRLISLEMKTWKRRFPVFTVTNTCRWMMTGWCSCGKKVYFGLGKVLWKMRQ